MNYRILPVFVYGTLMQGQANHRLLARAEFVCKAKTAPQFELADLGFFPAMLRGGKTVVEGELYMVDLPTLNAMDRLEGHPHFYKREHIKLEDGDDALAYLMHPSHDKNFERIPSGNWRAQKRGA